MQNLSIFTPDGSQPDAGAIKQMETCMKAGDAYAGSLSADHHLGYSAPIGGTIAYANYVSPSSVGYDIGCGNKAVATNLLYSEIQADMSGIMDEIVRRISFGMGQPAKEQADHPVLDKIERAEFSQQRQLAGLARKQLGTVGAGNHYVDLFAEEGTDRVWIGVHFGSRGFGHKTASGFLSLAQGLAFDDHPAGESMHAEPTLFRIDEWLGYAYINAMNLAGEYAYAGRDVVCEKVLDILGATSVKEVHNHHNFSWEEEHKGVKLHVVRKGATPLFPGQQGFVGGSMGENAVIIEGLPGDAGDAALWSAPHGAGRAMSRTEAKGKQRKRWNCKDCGRTQQPGEAAWRDEGYGIRCPGCLGTNTAKRWVTEKDGKVDWQATLLDLKAKGITLRGGDADEAPDAYKRLPAVLEAHKEYVTIKHQLRPVGVAMAGRGTRDDYKD